MNYYLGLDVGGTNIKCGIMDEDGRLLFDKIFTYHAHSNESEEAIIDNFITIFSNLTEAIDDPDKKIKAIGLAFPGPFDYERGISLMQGIGKYEGIYNVNLREKFLINIHNNQYLKGLMHKDLKITFLHDVEAFALGEIYFGRGRGHSRVIYLCIGTGSGSAFSVNEKLVADGEGVPTNGWIYNTSFKDSIIDDYISARGLTAIACRYFDEYMDGKKLYLKACNQDEKALQVFKEFGQDFFEAIVTFIRSFKADCIILGGEIAKSFKYFGMLTEDFCKSEKIDILITYNTSKSTLFGLYKKLKSGE